MKNSLVNLGLLIANIAVKEKSVTYKLFEELANNNFSNYELVTFIS